MDTLTGSVERITYHNPQNGYTVLRLLPSSGRRSLNAEDDLLTVVGLLPEVQPGEHLKLTGRWRTDAKFGRQFAAEHCEQTLPAEAEGIRRYLGSGLIKGIGPRTADKIVAAFGAETLYVLDQDPGRLRQVREIGPKRYGAILSAWEEQKAIKDVMVFLQGHGVTTRLAVKIFKQYGAQALDIVQQEPYRLADDIWGIGFRTADKIALALGLPSDAPARLEAGLRFTLSQAADDGHVFLPVRELIGKAALLLAAHDRAADDDPGRAGPEPASGPAVATLESAVARLAERDLVRLEEAPDGAQVRDPAGPVPLSATTRVYLPPFAQAETAVARRLRARLAGRQPEAASDGAGQAALFDLGPLAPAGRWLDDFAKADWATLLAPQATLSDEQRAAVRLALSAPVCVLTGGPGTGKTTTLRAVLDLAEAAGHPVALAAPTGRAAKRLSEATGRPAQTLHRLLGFSPVEGFTSDEARPLPAHLVVVDETSMIDLLLFHHLLKAVDARANLLLVGDTDQLPSVGAGDVLRDLTDSGVLPVVRLTQIFRQAAESEIIVNAHRINHGQPPNFARQGRDLYLFPAEEADEAARWVVEVVAERMPHKFGLDPLSQIQVLTPLQRGAAGVAALNQALQVALNPAGGGRAERALGGRVLRSGDRVMQLRNNYDKEVFNGDIGRVLDLDLIEQRVSVDFDGRRVDYDFSEADELEHAFAVSVHKSQGSEYPAVVLCLVMQHYPLLQRNLLYTAITRARDCCVVVGSRKALALAARRADAGRRHSALAERLR